MKSSSKSKIFLSMYFLWEVALEPNFSITQLKIDRIFLKLIWLGSLDITFQNPESDERNFKENYDEIILKVEEFSMEKKRQSLTWVNSGFVYL